MVGRKEGHEDNDIYNDKYYKKEDHLERCKMVPPKYHRQVKIQNHDRLNHNLYLYSTGCAGAYNWNIDKPLAHKLVWCMQTLIIVCKAHMY